VVFEVRVTYVPGWFKPHHRPHNFLEALVAQWEGVPIETRLYGAKLRLRDVKRPYS